MSVFDDPRVKRYQWTSDEGYDVDLADGSWAVVHGGGSPWSPAEWWARSYKDKSGDSDRGPFVTSEQAITTLLDGQSR